MKRSYNTKQKDSIMLAIDSFGEKHFTAEDIFRILASDSGVGVSTIYRHLDKLAGEGKIQKYFLEGQGACYQKKECKEKHFHLKCTKCGRLEHLSCDNLKKISSHVLDEHGFEIDSARTVFYGVCRECREANEEN